MLATVFLRQSVFVVPHAGTWIEIPDIQDISRLIWVVPHAGTWIEIIRSGIGESMEDSRSPRGNVD